MTNKLPNTEDTICAICTPPGIGSISVIRLSGPMSENIANKIFKTLSPNAKLLDRNVAHGKIIKDDRTIDECLCLFFKSPNSYTGEDVIEFQTHGGDGVPNLVIRYLIEEGARIANPGEFTYRAFMNGKIDLLKAEAISSLINSQAESAEHHSFDRLSTNIAKKLNNIRELAILLIAQLEAGIDFPEEDIPKIEKLKLLDEFDTVINKTNDILETYKSGSLYLKGLRIMIMGEPNVGKSTFLNNIISDERSIVSEIPGTTRDIVNSDIYIKGIRCNFFDTAGLRDADNLIEKKGIDKALEKIPSSDLILLLLEKTSNFQYIQKIVENVPRGKIIYLINKCDLIVKDETWEIEKKLLEEKIKYIKISSKNGTNIEDVKEKIIELKSLDNATDFSEGLVTTERQANHLKKGIKKLKKSMKMFKNNEPVELITIDLRDFVAELGKVTGETTNEDIYDALFSKFCVGK